jgi:hypothetical protein
LRFAGGVRLLRSNLFQPPIDLETIEERHEAVGELLRTPELYQGLRTALARFPDLEQILALCAQAPGAAHLPNIHQIDMKMDRMVGLSQLLEYLPPLASLVEGTTSRLLVRWCSYIRADSATTSLQNGASTYWCISKQNCCMKSLEFYEKYINMFCMEKKPF